MSSGALSVRGWRSTGSTEGSSSPTTPWSRNRSTGHQHSGLERPDGLAEVVDDATDCLAEPGDVPGHRPKAVVELLSELVHLARALRHRFLAPRR